MQLTAKVASASDWGLACSEVIKKELTFRDMLRKSYIYWFAELEDVRLQKDAQKTLHTERRFWISKQNYFKYLSLAAAYFDF